MHCTAHRLVAKLAIFCQIGDSLREKYPNGKANQQRAFAFGHLASFEITEWPFCSIT